MFSESLRACYSRVCRFCYGNGIHSIFRYLPVNNAPSKVLQFPAALTGIDTLSELQLSSGRWCFTLAGISGWCWEYPCGLCVALQLDPPSADDRWLLQTCLWLASVKEALDDSIIAQDGLYFLVRHYPSGCERAVVEAGCVHQVAIARWLSTYEENKAPVAGLSMVGRWV